MNLVDFPHEILLMIFQQLNPLELTCIKNACHTFRLMLTPKVMIQFCDLTSLNSMIVDKTGSIIGGFETFTPLHQYVYYQTIAKFLYFYRCFRKAMSNERAAFAMRWISTTNLGFLRRTSHDCDSCKLIHFSNVRIPFEVWKVLSFEAWKNMYDFLLYCPIHKTMINCYKRKDRICQFNVATSVFVQEFLPILQI